MFRKLKLLGFVHPTNNRPIGNVRYLNFNDFVIIWNFSYLYSVILIWFFETSDFSSLTSFVKLLKKSCILTLCRKHNKSKLWVNSVYTNNILVLKNLFNSYNYFPSSNFLHGRFSTVNMLLIDEAFFIVR